MRIYIVVGLDYGDTYGFTNTDILAVFSSEENAQSYINSYDDYTSYDDFEIIYEIVDYELTKVKEGKISDEN